MAEIAELTKKIDGAQPTLYPSKTPPALATAHRVFPMAYTLGHLATGGKAFQTYYQLVTCITKDTTALTPTALMRTEVTYYEQNLADTEENKALITALKHILNEKRDAANTLLQCSTTQFSAVCKLTNQLIHVVKKFSKFNTPLVTAFEQNLTATRKQIIQAAFHHPVPQFLEKTKSALQAVAACLDETEINKIYDAGAKNTEHQLAASILLRAANVLPPGRLSTILTTWQAPAVEALINVNDPYLNPIDQVDLWHLTRNPTIPETRRLLLFKHKRPSTQQWRLFLEEVDFNDLVSIKIAMKRVQTLTMGTASSVSHHLGFLPPHHSFEFEHVSGWFWRKLKALQPQNGNNLNAIFWLYRRILKSTYPNTPFPPLNFVYLVDWVLAADTPSENAPFPAEQPLYQQLLPYFINWRTIVWTTRWARRRNVPLGELDKFKELNNKFALAALRCYLKTKFDLMQPKTALLAALENPHFHLLYLTEITGTLLHTNLQALEMLITWLTNILDSFPMPAYEFEPEAMDERLPQETTPHATTINIEADQQREVALKQRYAAIERIYNAFTSWLEPFLPLNHKIICAKFMLELLEQAEQAHDLLPTAQADIKRLTKQADCLFAARCCNTYRVEMIEEHARHAAQSVNPAPLDNAKMEALVHQALAFISHGLVLPETVAPESKSNRNTLTHDLNLERARTIATHPKLPNTTQADLMKIPGKTLDEVYRSTIGVMPENERKHTFDEAFNPSTHKASVATPPSISSLGKQYASDRDAADANDASNEGSAETGSKGTAGPPKKKQKTAASNTTTTTQPTKRARPTIPGTIFYPNKQGQTPPDTSTRDVQTPAEMQL